MREACILVVALVALGGIAAADDYSDPFAIADSRVEPAYPPAAQAAGFEGSVAVAAVVNADGSVGVVEVVESSSPRLGFEDAAMDAIKQWQFEPARENGEPVDSVYAYVFHFRAARTSHIPGYVAGHFLSSTSMGGVMAKNGAMDGGQGGGKFSPAATVKRGPMRMLLPPAGPVGETLYDRRKLKPVRESGPFTPVSAK
jgi:protein TonB